MTLAQRPTLDSPPTWEYQPFPDMARRNLLQELVEIPLMVRALGLPRGVRVLEVGCGRGIALPVLQDLLRPTRLVGLDIEPAFLAEAESGFRGRGVSAELIHADVRRMPFDDHSFDVVIDFGTCYHIARPEWALREIRRVLSPGGWLVYETPVSQLLSHPVRSFGRRLPWDRVPGFARWRGWVLWGVRRRVAW